MNAPEWLISDKLVDYPQALALMEQRVADIRDSKTPELVWLLEHPPLYTAGTSAKPQDLLSPDRFPVYQTGRGGQYTYHGPGQRVGYVMLDLKARNLDLHAFVHGLEEWLILTLDQFNLKGERLLGLTGVWVKSALGWRKIAAIGVRVRRWVSFHGIALNLDPDLRHFQGIVPCGVRDHGVTSLWEEGLTITLPELDMVLKDSFTKVF